MTESKTFHVVDTEVTFDVFTVKVIVSPTRSW